MFKKVVKTINSIVGKISKPLLKLPLIGGFLKSLSNPVVRSKVFFTVGAVVLYRFLANVPPPGIDVDAFAEIFKDNPLSNIFTLATGGRLDNPSVVMIGLGAYINASIIIQLLGSVIPKLEELKKEGARGREIMNQYTSYLAIPLSIIQAIVVYILMSRSSGFISQEIDLGVIAFVAVVSAGSLVLMWLGSLISEYGIGNGTSIIITFSIISSLPGLIKNDIQGVYPIIESFANGQISFMEMLTAPDLLILYGVIIGLTLMIVLIVYMNEGIRKISIQYARSGTGRGNNYLPIRINQSGVMPIIFASAILSFPSIIGQFLIGIFDQGSRMYSIIDSMNSSFLSDFSSIGYNVLYFIMIIAFTFFYTFVIQKPSDTADNLKKNGGFIPGIRPGASTHKHLVGIMVRLTTLGALFLSFITIVPTLIRTQLSSTGNNIGILSGIGGTSILIVVSVLLTTYRQIKAMKVSKSYDQYR